MDEKSALVLRNKDTLTTLNCRYSILQVTETMLSHSTVDASIPIRNLLATARIHSYDSQALGPDNKVSIETEYLAYTPIPSGLSTLYRSAGRGDCRIWFGTYSKKYLSVGDTIAIFAKDGIITILNLAKYDINRAIRSDFSNPIKDFLCS